MPSENAETLNSGKLKKHLPIYEKCIYTDLSVSSLQCGVPSPAESIFNPESCKSLLLRSSSLKDEEFDLRAEAKVLQPASVIKQLDSL